MKYARFLLLAAIVVFFAWGIYHTRISVATSSPDAPFYTPFSPMPPSGMAKSTSGTESFDGMIFPVDRISGIKWSAPSPNRHPVDTVWCGSYYYFPANYTPKNDSEMQRFASRSTGSGSHPGIDIALDVGTPIRSVANGTVIFCEWRVGWGNLVVIEHMIPREGKVYSCYGHLSSITKGKGAVRKGDLIGYSGASGAPYPHLHFQIDRNSFPYYPDSTGAYPYSSPLHPVNRLDSLEQVKKNTFEPVDFITSRAKHPAIRPSSNLPQSNFGSAAFLFHQPYTTFDKSELEQTIVKKKEQ